MTFDQLGLSAQLLRAVAAEGYTSPTPIQVQAIPYALAGRDVLGLAQTGTGKTAAFALPTLQRLSQAAPAPAAAGGRGPRRKIRCLVLTPTRELATQVGESFATYGKETGLRHTVIFGGVGQGNQVDAVARGVDILVATPGRLLDLLNQRLVTLEAVSVLVLDEADRMLDMGFIRDVKRIIAMVPKQRQTLFFSATLPPEVQSLVDSMLVKPARVEVTPVSSTAEKVSQSVYFVEKGDKRALLVSLLSEPKVKRVLVFTRTKSGANRLQKQLAAAGITGEAIHGNKSQNARERALGGFRTGEVKVLIATDIAARGIDVEEITHVVNYDLPNVPETYVHRIGRTARAGATGEAISLCDREERAYLRDIEKVIGQKVPVVADHPFTRPGSGAASEPVIASSGGGESSGRRSGQGARGQGHSGQRSQPSGEGSRRRGGGGGGGAGSGGRSGGGGRGGSGRGGGSRGAGASSGARSSGGSGQSSSAPAPAAGDAGRRPKPSMPRWF